MVKAAVTLISARLLLTICTCNALCFFQDPDGEHARRAMQKVMATTGGMGVGPGGPVVSVPPSILNNPNIPNEIIHALQAGRLGSTVFVANVSKWEHSLQ